MNNDEIEIRESIALSAPVDSGFAIAYALLKLADAHQTMAANLRKLGLGDAATPMGAIELLAKEVKEGMESVTAAIDGIRLQ